MPVERDYVLVFPDEVSGTAAFTHGLQRSPYSGQLHGPAEGSPAGWTVYFTTFDEDPPADDALESERFFRRLAETHGGTYIGLRG